MRVTFVLASANLSGGTRVALMIGEHLRSRGYDVLFVFPPPAAGSLRGRFRDIFLGRAFRQAKIDLTYFRELNLTVPYRVLESHRPIEDRDLPDADAVIATFWLTAEWVSKLSPVKGAKLYFIQQYEANFGHPTDRVDATWRLPMKKIVCSNWLAEFSREKFGDPSAIVVPNGVDTKLFFAPARNLQPKPTIGFLYAPKNAAKRTDIALEVLNAVRRRVPDVQVQAFGSGPIDVAFSLPPGSVYTQRPPQNELRNIYAKCDAWLCSSSSEGFHLPPHEAMACRCPVVSTKVGGPTDLICDGVNGYLTDVGDVDGLTDRLVRVITADNKTWQKMSEAAYATAIEYTWEYATDLFEAALRNSVVPRYAFPD